MKKCIVLIFMAAVALTLSDAAQFGAFNDPSSQSTTPAPKSRLGGLLSGGVLNILKPVTSLLDLVGEAVGRILNLLIGGLKYRPYKKMTTTSPPGASIEITTPPPKVAIEITEPPPKMVIVIGTPATPKDHSTEKATDKSGAEVTTAKPTTTTQASITEMGKPENVDWRRLNCSSPVRFQGKCRGSFAFAVVAAVEVQTCFKTGRYTILSPQNLIDCTTVSPFENSGCDGGALEPTFDYVVNVGINSEADYPYTAAAAKCNFNQDKSIGRIRDYMSIDEGDEETMEYVLNNVGPIAVGIDATHKSFADYQEGIYYESKCKSDIESLNHAVLLVGYGVEPDGKRYWIIRNSYGTDWGDNGYGKIARDPKNHCGITTYVVYPIVS